MIKPNCVLKKSLLKRTNFQQTLNLKIPIKKYGLVDDIKSSKYNKLIKLPFKMRHEKMYKQNSSYDLLIPINYNVTNTKKGKGSAIFLHLTRNYKQTLGCIAIKKKDMLILIKLINNKSKIKIA